MKPKNNFVLYHTHGIGKYDFSTISGEDLYAINEIAQERSCYLCPTIFLPKENIEKTEKLLEFFTKEKKKGNLDRIFGISLEGPMLGPNGGIPYGGVWDPTKEDWEKIVHFFKMGLKYMVITPDRFALNEEVENGFSFRDLVSSVYNNGGRIALGHFERGNPKRSAKRVKALLDFLESEYEPSEYLVLSDHFLNDMPRNFKHAYRTSDEKVNGEEELKSFLEIEWEESILEDLLGPVPAYLLKEAKDKRIMLALNFDGLHVDLNICKRIIDYVGDSSIIAMTDHIETDSILGQNLSEEVCPGLLYRPDGVLAASAVVQEKQVENMIKCGISGKSIDKLFFSNPYEATNYVPVKRKKEAISNP